MEMALLMKYKFSAKSNATNTIKVTGSLMLMKIIVLIAPNIASAI